MIIQNKKTILFIYPTYPYPRLGGVARVTDSLTHGFMDKGYRILHLYYQNSTIPDYDFRAPMFVFPSSNYMAEENFVFYHQFLKEQNVDIIINQSGNFGDSRLFLSIGDNANVKTISALHSTPLVSYNFLDKELLRLKNNTFKEKIKLVARFILFPILKFKYKKSRINHFAFLFKNTDIVCMESDKFKNELQSIYPGSLKNVYAIGNPNSFKVKSIPEEKEKIILFVGRMEIHEKRPDRLLKIWEKVYLDFPEWKLIFLGNGSAKELLEKKSKKLNRVHFMGAQDVKPYYEKASILCMTSNFEGFGMVLTEAMQFGVVPMAFNSFASVVDIITDGENGILVKPFDLDEYALKLKLLMSDEEKRIEMSKKGFESVKKFDIEPIITQWEELFEHLK